MLQNLRHRQPLMHRLIELMSENESESEMVDTVHRIQHDAMHYYTDFVMVQSCYYPLIIMWYRRYALYYTQIHGENGGAVDNKFDEKLRIIQSETFFEAPLLTMQHALCWVIGGEDLDLTECKKKYAVYWTKSDQKEIHLNLAYAFKQNQAPIGFDVLSTNLSVVLKQLYGPCNDRLYEFLDGHSSVILGSNQWIPWW